MGLLHFAQYYEDTLYSPYTTGTTTAADSAIATVILIPFLLVGLVVAIIGIIALWKIFVKAGRPGWAAVVPVYNSWVLFELVGYPGWWSLLSFVPFISFFPAVMTFVAYYKIAKLFGKSDGFAICNVLFPYVTLPILAFGSSTFQGTPVASAGTMPQPAQYPSYGPQVAAPTVVTPPTPPAQPYQPPQPPQGPQSPLVQ